MARWWVWLLWLEREGLQGLADRPSSGRRRVIATASRLAISPIHLWARDRSVIARGLTEARTPSTTNTVEYHRVQTTSHQHMEQEKGMRRISHMDVALQHSLKHTTSTVTRTATTSMFLTMSLIEATALLLHPAQTPTTTVPTIRHRMIILLPHRSDPTLLAMPRQARRATSHPQRLHTQGNKHTPHKLLIPGSRRIKLSRHRHSSIRASRGRRLMGPIRTSKDLSGSNGIPSSMIPI